MSDKSHLGNHRGIVESFECGVKEVAKSSETTGVEFDAWPICSGRDPGTSTKMPLFFGTKILEPPLFF